VAESIGCMPMGGGRRVRNVNEEETGPGRNAVRDGTGGTSVNWRKGTSRRKKEGNVGLIWCAAPADMGKAYRRGSSIKMRVDLDRNHSSSGPGREQRKKGQFENGRLSLGGKKWQGGSGVRGGP